MKPGDYLAARQSLIDQFDEPENANGSLRGNGHSVDKAQGTTKHRPVVNMSGDRINSIIGDTPALFEVSKNPDATADQKLWEVPQEGFDAVKRHDPMIDKVAAKHGVDPDLIRAVMWAENARGHKYGLNDLADKLGVSGSKMPMNINPNLWGKLVGTNTNLADSRANIEASAILIKRIQSRVADPTDAAIIGTIWNSAGKEKTSDFGEYIGKLYRDKPWTGEAPISKDSDAIYGP